MCIPPECVIYRPLILSRPHRVRAVPGHSPENVPMAHKPHTIQLLAATGLMLVLLIACSDTVGGHDHEDDPEYNLTYISPSAQRDGDAGAGFQYLVTGDYLNSGVPIEVFKQALGENQENALGREGDNATLSHFSTAVDAPNGTRVVTQNCLLCHAEYLNGELVVGLGNNTRDFTVDNSQFFGLLTLMVENAYGAESPEREAFESYRRAIVATGPQIVTKVRGTNPADKLTFVLAAHRDPQTLEWRDVPSPALPPADEIIPSDVPAWWLLKYKHAMFYSGIGRGSFSRLLMAASILTLSDSIEARQTDQHFGDVLAYINSIEAPKYPWPVDEELAADGKQIFESTCSDCHGKYSDGVQYPNVVVPLDVIDTDPMLTESYSGLWSAHVNLFNSSWFAQGEYSARIEASDGYVAPPLVGVWATAPYLHNGSVPTLLDMLDSKNRPAAWKRRFDNSDYDKVKGGWRYDVQSTGGDDSEIYDSSLPGHGNGGHRFGDKLTDAERSAVIEYLKTL